MALPVSGLILPISADEVDIIANSILRDAQNFVDLNDTLMKDWPQPVIEHNARMAEMLRDIATRLTDASANAIPTQSFDDNVRIDHPNGLSVLIGRNDPEEGHRQHYVGINTERSEGDDTVEGDPVICIGLNDGTVYDREINDEGQLIYNKSVDIDNGYAANKGVPCVLVDDRDILFATDELAEKFAEWKNAEEGTDMYEADTVYPLDADQVEDAISED